MAAAVAVSHSFKTVFAVPMTCDACVKSVSDSLSRLAGVTDVEANLEQQLVAVQGTAPPSAIARSIQDTGKDAILRGSGEPNSAAVSILECYADMAPSPAAVRPVDPNRARQVRGLARLVQIAGDTTIVDLAVRGVTPGRYRATVRAFGDLGRGAASTGPTWHGFDASDEKNGGDGGDGKGVVALLEVGPDGNGSAFVESRFRVWELIGRGMVVARDREGDGEGEGKKTAENDEDTLAGVIARSAGAWDNDKVVCACTGKTLWEERADEVRKGML